MEQYLINHCAPTLASLKTANLFNYSFASEYELEAQLLHLNTLLAVKGVSLTIIRKTADSALIYVYRSRKLAHDLANKTASCMLKKLGYTDLSPESAIAHLAERINRTGDFPHEIGLFLAIRPAMSWATSRTAARTANAAAAGRSTATNVRHARRFADSTSAKRCIV